MNPFRVILVEDEYLFALDIREDIVQEFSLDPEAVKIFTSESMFLKWLQALPAQAAVDVIILDIMLPWSNPESPEPRSSEAERDGYHSAGIRCLRQLRKSSEMRITPVIIHSNLSTESIKERMREAQVSDENVRIIPKSGARKPLLKALLEIRESSMPNGDS